ncbi:hypothetical protein GGU10DRAFT_437883 [Lentinula aff. detonsa]|uniref:Uncharacterized protein n=1 Tax=Lentinula aff. detonsa TaxID=2804958 RepID=A0AA38KWG7_9AGAR|nr:hypothetical protein GGU10DRAFT_437883 [Lentinula aff. detonsa]
MLGSQIVYGIASGLDYLVKVFPTLGIKLEHFDVFSDAQGNTVLSFTPDITALEGGGIWEGYREKSAHYAPRRKDGSTAEGCFRVTMLDSRIQKDVNRDVDLCNSLISKVIFNDANYIVYGEKLHRQDDALQVQDLPMVDEVQVEEKQKHTAEEPGRIEASPASEATVGADDSATTSESITISCRREIVWVALNSAKSTLSEISSTYGDLLAIVTIDHGSGQPTHYLPQLCGKRRSAVDHQCPGYRREEITFTPDAFKNAIIIFEKPTRNEMCILCGEVVTTDPSSASGAGSLTRTQKSVRFSSLSSGPKYWKTKSSTSQVSKIPSWFYPPAAIDLEYQ